MAGTATKDPETQALKRLVKKLSALRATLRKDERALLDRLVIGEKSEVQGHAMMAPQALQSPQSAEVQGHIYMAPKGPQSARGRKRPQAAEVEGHSLMAPNAVMAASGRKRPESAEVQGHAFMAPQSAEVSGHTMQSAQTAMSALGLQGRIYLDQGKGVYTVQA